MALSNIFSREFYLLTGLVCELCILWIHCRGWWSMAWNHCSTSVVKYSCKVQEEWAWFMYSVQTFMKDTSKSGICNALSYRSNEGPLSWKLTLTPLVIVRKLYYIYLTRANTVSEDSAGDGAITTSGSPSSTSSQSIWMWKNTGQKHLKPHWGILIHLTS